MTAKQVRKLSDAALAYTIRDLRETVEVQERNVRAGIPMHKLGDYWDDLHACIGERNRRRKGVAV